MEKKATRYRSCGVLVVKSTLGRIPAEESKAKVERIRWMFVLDLSSQGSRQRVSTDVAPYRFTRTAVFGRSATALYAFQVAYDNLSAPGLLERDRHWSTAGGRPTSTSPIGPQKKLPGHVSRRRRVGPKPLLGLRAPQNPRQPYSVLVIIFIRARSTVPNDLASRLFSGSARSLNNG